MPVSARFEELGWQQTPMGVISLRRRFDPTVRADVYEVKLDDEHVMSSLFTVAERELARLGLARTTGAALDVVVGGLGLGYIRTLTVIEYSDAVIDWHQRDLLPDTIGLAADDRVTITHADFFAAAMGKVGFDPEHPGRTFDAILLDIDHSPRHVLHDPHADFYTHDGLTSACAHLRPGGVFAMWSDDPPDDDFTSLLGTVFTAAEARTENQRRPSTSGPDRPLPNSVPIPNRV